jgi:hypothetical protein
MMAILMCNPFMYQLSWIFNDHNQFSFMHRTFFMDISSGFFEWHNTEKCRCEHFIYIYWDSQLTKVHNAHPPLSICGRHPKSIDLGRWMKAHKIRCCWSTSTQQFVSFIPRIQTAMRLLTHLFTKFPRFSYIFPSPDSPELNKMKRQIHEPTIA